MTANRDAIEALSNAELLRYFKILFKDARFINTAIPSENQEYTMSTGGRVGNTPQTETANLAVVFLDESNEHRDELIDTLEGFYRVTGIKGEDLNRVNPLPSIFREVMTITTNDGETWHLYQGSDGKAPYNHLPWPKQQFARNLFLLTPEGLRKTIATQIDHVSIDFGRLQEKIKASQALATEIATAMAVLEKLPGNLLPESLNNANPETLISLAERLGEISAIISPKGPEGLESQVVMNFGKNTGLQGGAG